MATFVMRSSLQVSLRFTQALDGCCHLGLCFIAAAFPSPIPAAVAPVAATPAAELGAVDRAAFAILEHSVLPIWPTGIDAKRLLMPLVWVHAERAIAHPEGTVLTSKLLQTVGDVHVMAGSSVLSAQDD